MTQVEIVRTETMKKAGKATKGGTYYVLSLLPLVGVAYTFFCGGALYAIRAI